MFIHIQGSVLTFAIIIIYIITMIINTNKGKKNRIKVSLFFAYIIALQMITINDIMIYKTISINNLNLVPFIYMIRYLTSRSFDAFIYNVLGNIFLFIPMGIFLKLFKIKKLISVVIICFCVSLSIEFFQSVFGARIFDIDDIICNVTGAILGYVLIKKLLFFRNASKAH